MDNVFLAYARIGDFGFAWRVSDLEFVLVLLVERDVVCDHVEFKVMQTAIVFSWPDFNVDFTFFCLPNYLAFCE